MPSLALLRLKKREPDVSDSIPESLWAPELEKGSLRFHIIGGWVAVLFVPVFGITDFLNIPEHWLEIFCLRLVNSIFVLILLMNRERWKMSSGMFGALIFLGISLQNAYTFRLLGQDQLIEHALNYLALMIATGMFAMWDVRTSLLVLIPSAIITGIFIGLNPDITAVYYFEHGGVLITCVGIFMGVVIEFRRSISIREIKDVLALKAANEALAEQKAIVDEKNRSINDSIAYARQLQRSMLGNAQDLAEHFASSAIIFLPKDVLSGDFHWVHRDEASGRIVLAVADCTGHGVPAAMMTIMGQGILKRTVIEQRKLVPSEILTQMDRQVLDAFTNHAANEDQVNDGMDVGVLVIEGNRLLFSGAKMPLIIVRANGMLTQIKGSRFPIGSNQYDEEKSYETHSITLEKGDRIYLYSDGFIDQFGGPSHKRFSTRALLNLLESSSRVAMPEQQNILLNAHLKWKGNNEQTDDLLLVGFEA